MNRVNVYLSALAALGLAASAASAQAPAGAPAAAPTRGTAVFNVVKVQKDYQKWQYFAEMMNKERTAKGAELAQIRNAVVDIEGKLRIETVEAKKKELEQQLVGLQRQFEDKERMIRKEIEDKSATHLRQLFAEIRTVVDKVAEVNGFTLVLAFPDALTAEEMSNPLYIEMKMRPPAAMPFYVSPSIDITKVVIDTLNKNFPAPGPVSPAGGTAPAGGAPPGTAGTQPGGMK